MRRAYGLSCLLSCLFVAVARAQTPVIDAVVQDDTELTLTGSGFGATQGGSRALMDFLPLSVTSWSDTEVKTIVDASFRAGSRFVAIQMGGSFSAPANVLLHPVIASVTPDAGVVGDLVTVTGAFFGDDPVGNDAVLFGGTNGLPLVPPSSEWSPSQIRFSLPDTRATLAAIVVRVSDELSPSNETVELVPAIDDLDPASARVGDVVTLIGAGYGSSPAVSDTVFLNGHPITSFLAWGAHSIQVRVPIGACNGDGPSKLVIGGVHEAPTPTIFSLLPPHGLLETDLFVDGGSVGGAVHGFADGDTLRIALDADRGLQPDVRLNPQGGPDVVLPAVEGPPGTYTASFHVDAGAIAYPGDGDFQLEIAVSNTCSGGTATLTYARTVRFDTVAPEISLVRRDNNPPPGQADQYMVGDSVDMLLRGDDGTADFALVKGAEVAPLGTAVRIGEDYLLSYTVPSGMSGLWRIRGGLTDVAGNRTEVLDLDDDDLVAIVDGSVPSIDRILLTTPPHDVPDAIGAGEQATFRLGTASVSAAAARVFFTPVGQTTSTAHLDLPSVPPDGSAGETRAFSASLAAGAIPEGRYQVEYLVCTSPSLPGACTIGGGCNCRPLVGRVLVVDRTLPAIGLLLTREGPQAFDAGCDPFVIGAGDDLVLRLEVDEDDPFLEASWQIPGLGVGPRPLGAVDGGFEDRFHVTGGLEEGSFTLEVALTDGVNTSDPAATRTIVIDHDAPLAPNVAVSSTSGELPPSIGDVLTVSATAAEAGLDAYVTIGDHVTDAPMVEGPPGEHRFAWTVPADLVGRDEQLAVAVVLSDCAHDSPAGTAGPVHLVTTAPEVDLVIIGGGDCQSLDGLLRITAIGAPGASSAEASLTSTLGDLVTPVPIPLAESDGVYAVDYDFTEPDSTRIADLIEQGRRFFVVRVMLSRGGLHGPPEVSNPFEFREASPQVVDVTSVGDGGVPVGDRLVVPAPAFSLGGTKHAGESVVARHDAGPSRLLVAADEDTLWRADVDLADFGWSGETSFPLTLLVEACGRPGPPHDFVVTFDAVPPTAGTFALEQDGEPIEVDRIEGDKDLVITISGDDDQGAPLGLIRYTTGDPERGGLHPVETILMAPVDPPEGPPTLFRGMIPASRIGPEGLRFEVLVTDGANAVSTGVQNPAVRMASLSTDRPGSFFEIDARGGGLPPAQWHMISAPATLTTSASAIFEAEGLGEPDPANWRLLRWRSTGPTGGSYESSDDGTISFAPGNAYWWQWRQSSPRVFAFDLGRGRTLPLTPFDLTLNAGWNQIGTPFAFPTAWPDSAPPLRTYVGARNDYLPESEGERVLRPFAGYFVYASARTTITLDPEQEITPGPSPDHPAGYASVPGAWALRVSLETPEGWDAYNYLGVHPAASARRDGLDLAAMPAPAGAPEVAFASDREDDRLDADIRPEVADEVVTWELVVTAPASIVDAEVRWQWVAPAPEAIALVLVDRRNGRVVDMRTEHALAVDLLAGERYALDVLAGPRERVLEVAGQSFVAPPPRLVMGAPFPNPFVDGVRVDYAIPSPSPVVLTVVDATGRQVLARAMTEPAAGGHTFVWDGRDRRGRAVAPGIYFLVLASGEARVERRIVRLGKGR